MKLINGEEKEMAELTRTVQIEITLVTKNLKDDEGAGKRLLEEEKYIEEQIRAGYRYVDDISIKVKSFFNAEAADDYEAECEL